VELKEYQKKVLERFDGFLEQLSAEQEKSKKVVKALADAGLDVPKGADNYAKNAWDAVAKTGHIPRIKTTHGLIIPEYINRYNGCAESFPHVCLKVPTGGGKTLLAAECVGKLHTDFLNRQTGLVLWIMPTVQIYNQTWKALANREHPYRQMLERASGGRVKVFEKDDPINAYDVKNHLCVMLVRLAAANRTSNKEFLKIFRDAGKYKSFFPEVDDYNANNKLLQTYKDLETADLDDGGGLIGVSVKHSLVNVFKMIRPVVVIDEGHKAYAPNTRDSLNNFNPSFVVELSATPNPPARERTSNVLVDVSGIDLKDEQMIKLPINISNVGKDNQGDWKLTLTQAHAKRKALEEDGHALQAQDGRYIRPIMLIRVEITDEKKRDGIRLNALDAKDYLINQLNVRETEIKIKSANVDELGTEDLFEPTCQVRYIITKEALQEGWDCSFAYVLALLDKTKANTALTQMIGRVLRQPDARITSMESLNQCYVYCFNQNVNDAVKQVRKGLEDEGMTGLASFVQATGGQDAPSPEDTKIYTIPRRDKYKGLQIFLPKVLHKTEQDWRDIDYEQDILATINWDDVNFDAKLILDDVTKTEVSTTVIDVNRKENLLDTQGELDLTFATKKENLVGDKKIEISFLARQLMDIIPNPWQASRIIMATLETLKSKYTEEVLYHNRLNLIEFMRRSLHKAVNELSEKIFKQKLASGEISFQLMTNGNKHLNFAIAQELQLRARKNEPKLFKKDNSPIENELFEIVFEKDINGLEKDFALYLSDSKSVYWWHRMVASKGSSYSLQGWQKNKVYPDFIACTEDNKMYVLETKGLHLKGNDDTKYKKALFDLMTTHQQKIGNISLEDGKHNPISLTMLMEDNWEQEFKSLL